MATLPIQQQRQQSIPANEKQLPPVPLNDTYPMNYLNQNYHKVFNLSLTKRDDSTQPDELWHKQDAKHNTPASGKQHE